MALNEVTMQRCRSCGGTRATQSVVFHRNVGMLFARPEYTFRGSLCETCIHKLFWKFEALNVALGPWGTISMIVTPIYFLQNIFSYLTALYQLRRRLAAGEFAQASRFSLLKVLTAVGVGVLVLLAIRTAANRQHAVALFANVSARHSTQEILCGNSLKSVRLFSAPDFQAVTNTSLKCGETVVPLAHQGDWTKLQTQRGDEGFLPKWYVGVPTNNLPYKSTKCNRPSPMQNVGQYERLKAALDGFIDAENISGKEFRDTTEDLASQAYFLAYLTADDPGRAKAGILMDAVNDPKIEDAFSRLPASEQGELQTWYGKTLAVMSKAFDLGYKDGAKVPCGP